MKNCACSSDDQVRTTITDPLVEVYVLAVEGHDQGLLELDRREAPDIELAYSDSCPRPWGRGRGGG